MEKTHIFIYYAYFLGGFTNFTTFIPEKMKITDNHLKK